jgi:hypothetical protein
MVTFCLAFLIMCFDKSSMATRCVVGLVSFFIAALFVCCIWFSWKIEDRSSKGVTNHQWLGSSIAAFWLQLSEWWNILLKSLTSVQQRDSAASIPIAV